jgi:chemotaxis protein MotB
MLDKNQPIIVKKIKKGGHGHHGGAWKIAYADFVTAMMAFFLLMWLLATSTPEQMRAISEYFQKPTALSGGDAGAHSSLISIGSAISYQTKGFGESPQPSYVEKNESAELNNETIKKEAEKIEKEILEDLQERIEAAIAKHESLKPYKDQLLIEMTEDGLRIQIIDKKNRAMFAVGSAQLQYYTIKILRELGKMINHVPNRISIAGHTDALKYSPGARYTNWELSADRANASRRELLAGGMEAEKIARVVGLASNALLKPEEPTNPANRRISITVLKKAADEEMIRESQGIPHTELPNFIDLPPKLLSDDVSDPLPIKGTGR